MKICILFLVEVGVIRLDRCLDSTLTGFVAQVGSFGTRVTTTTLGVQMDLLDSTVRILHSYGREGALG